MYGNRVWKWFLQYVYESTDQQLPTTTISLALHANGDVQRSVDRWFFDASGQLIEYVWRVAPSGMGRARSRMEWSGGRVVTVLNDLRDDGLDIVEHRYLYENDLLVELSSRQSAEDEPHWRLLWRYDDDGRLVEEEDWRGGHGHSVVTYGYDDRDRVINSSAAASNGRIIANTTVVYEGCL